MQLLHPAVQVSPAHDWFMNNLSEIQHRSRAGFSRLHAEEREEAMAEVIGTVFQAGVNAAKRGVLHRITPRLAVIFAMRHYRQGRRLAGYSSTDVSSPATQIKGRNARVGDTARNREKS